QPLRHPWPLRPARRYVRSAGCLEAFCESDLQLPDSQAAWRDRRGEARPHSWRAESSDLSLFRSLSSVSACFPPKPGLNGGALEFTQGVGSNPARRTCSLLPDSLRCANRFAVQSQIAFANVSQSPVDRLSHEVALIMRFALNDP